MFIKFMLIGLAILAVCIGIGIAEDNNNSIATQVRGCQQTSDNSGYIGFRCLGQQYFVPVSERSQLEGGK